MDSIASPEVAADLESLATAAFATAEGVDTSALPKILKEPVVDNPPGVNMGRWSHAFCFCLFFLGTFRVCIRMS